MRVNKGTAKVRMKMIYKFIGGLGVALMAMPGLALTLQNPAMSVEQMAKSSDEIVVGNVLKVEPKLIGRSFETEYQIEVHERLKGASADKSPSQVFSLTLPGAALTTPPLTQYVTGVPYLGKGEEVLLFLKNGNSAAAARIAASKEPQLKYSASPKIVGWNQGRFTLFNNPETGAKMVTRVNFENYGLINSSQGTEELLESIKAKRLPVFESKLVRAADFAKAAREKDPLEVTSADKEKLKLDKASQAGVLMSQMRQRGGVPAEDFAAFKAEVQRYADQN